MTQRLSVFVPVYGNETTLRELRDRLFATLDTIEDIDPEVIFVDDASPDGSWSVIEAMASADPRVHGLRLASNVGQLPAICAGWEEVGGGEILVSIDADLEHPPEAMPELVEAFRRGHDLVTTRRVGDPSRNVRGLGSRVVNLLARALGLPVTDVGSSYLVCTPRVASEMRRIVERTGRQMVLPTVYAAAHHPTTITVQSAKRPTSGYTTWKAVRLGGEFLVAELGPVAARGALLSSIGIAALSLHAPSRRPALCWAAVLGGLGLVGLWVPRTFRRPSTEPLYVVDARVGGSSSWSSAC